MNDDFGLPPAAPASTDPRVAELMAQLAEANAKLAARSTDEAPDSEGTGPADAQGFPRQYKKVRIFRGQAGDLDYVPLGIGGYVIKVTRDKDVILPSVFVQVLEHCVEDITIKSENGLETRPQLRFPYTVLGDATEAEYKQFQARMRDMGNNAALRQA